MPILIKNYTWRQTFERVILNVPIKGVNADDVFTSSNYLKIHSPPFLFEVCLWHPVIEEESTCTIENENTTFKLLKQTAEEWPTLGADISRQEALEVKKKAVDEAQEKAKRRLEENKAKKSERQRSAVREQICLSTKERELIDKTREEEKKAALAQMGWCPLATVTELADEQVRKSNQKKENKEIFKKITNDNSKNIVPAPRPTAKISVSFTPREFPTPSRESKIAEEQEWLSKQAEARRRTGFLPEDLRPEEQDPVWLCDKAQNFYNVGNYLGAVSAYSHALTLNNQLYELYAGRAAAHLALANYNRALTDSSKALELLTPAVPQNKEARARCHLCRGSALANMGLTPQGLGELKTAQGLLPQDPDIQAAILQIEKSQLD